MAASSEPNAASFFQHSRQISVVNSTFNMVAGDMDGAHYRDQGRGTRRSSVLSRLFSKISEVIPWSTESPRIVSRNNIKLLDQLSSERQYRIHSAKYKQRLVLVKVFQGTQAKKNFKEEKKQNQRLLHPSLLKMIGVSSFTTESPFIVYNFAPARGSVESQLASVLEKDLSDILLLGCKIVSELAIGIDYLSSEGARTGSSGNKSIEIFITDDDVLKIAPDFGSLLIEDGGRHDESNIDPLWGLFNDLCIKTFKQATCILYPDMRNRRVSSTTSIAEVSSAPDLDPATDVLGDTESLTSGVSSNLYFNELEGSASPRRELLWRESSGGSRSVHAVAKHYREFLEHLNLTVGQSCHSYAIPRKQAARPLRTVVHRCQGYRKEEITLTSDVSENAIISHFIPSLYERCPVCKEIVEEEEFRCPCGGNDDGIAPTIKCSTCSIWQHKSCVTITRNNLLFSCSFCTRLPDLKLDRKIPKKGKVRAKSGCYTCRIRRKKCDDRPDELGRCQTCVRFRLQCLGLGAKRPDWLRENNNVSEIREKIKNFLLSQGMIKGHSGTGPRSAEQEQTLLLADEQYHLQSESAQSNILVLSEDPPHGPLSNMRELLEFEPEPSL